MKTYTIYLIRNNVNGKVYVGQTIKSLPRRWTQHCCSAKKGSPLYIHRAMRKCGVGDFTVEVLATASNKELLSEVERFCIKHFRSNDARYGYNMTEGGEGATGSSAALKARWQEPEYRAMMMAHKCMSHSGQFKKGQVSPNKGVPRSAATKAKISAAGRGRSPHNLGKKTPDAIRAKQSEARLAYLKQHPDSGRVLRFKTPEERRALALKAWETKRKKFQ